MKQRESSTSGPLRGWVAVGLLLVLVWNGTYAQIRYSISEEGKEGTVVGDAAKDLGLDKNSLKDRNFRIVSGSTEPLFLVNQNDGILYVKRKVDREEVCGRSSTCLLNLKTVLENPLEIHYVAIDVVDVNDHSPAFSENETNLEISESAVTGARFQLQAARDADSGLFSVQQYKLSHSEHFRIEVKDRGEDRKIPFLVLQKQLDRETAAKHTLLLTAVDGGKPAKSGTIVVNVEVLDVNDNSPTFTKDVYSVTLSENTPVGATVIQVNVTDLDEGLNGEVIYLFGKEVDSNIMELFELNQNTGEISVKGKIDFEDNQAYEIDIRASDKGNAPLTTDKSVFIKVIDVNDNAPEIEVTSFSNSIPEDSRIGTTVALISVSDSDSGLNGKVICFLDEFSPFKLATSMQDRMYSIVTQASLDRENQALYDVRISCKDAGEPVLSSENTIRVAVSDVNDNRPQFSESPYTFYVIENNSAGSSIFSASAFDRDESDNALISYHILRDGANVNKPASFININRDNGDVLALKTIIVLIAMQCSKTTDYTPKYLQDTNYDGTLCHSIQYRSGDKRYMLVGPRMSIGSTIVPGSNANTLVLPDRRRASTECSKPTDYTSKYLQDTNYDGTLCHSIQYRSGDKRYIIIVLIAMQCSKTTDYTSKYLQETNYDGTLCHSIQYRSGDKRYMLVGPRMSIGSTIVPGSNANTLVLPDRRRASTECSKTTDYTSKYLQDTNYDGTLCHSIQYRSGDKRYMLVGPRMSIGSTIVPGSHANTLVLPDKRRTSVEHSFHVYDVTYDPMLFLRYSNI
ncbi:protocadherin alpha-8-like [Scomber scombrus]|uniref:Protocadherin alpha-8-like n=1 Tax=Scomber scombrus TaxID=13677 RepID=A0AAV1NAV6_SCOSC